MKSFLGWIPSHISIRGNKKADSSAKSGLELSCTKVGVTYHDFKKIPTCQDDWNGMIANQPVLG